MKSSSIVSSGGPDTLQDPTVTQLFRRYTGWVRSTSSRHSDKGGRKAKGASDERGRECPEDPHQHASSRGVKSSGSVKREGEPDSPGGAVAARLNSLSLTIQGAAKRLKAPAALLRQKVAPEGPLHHP